MMYIFDEMIVPRRRRKSRRRGRKRRQRGGSFPLAALIPALIARGKAAALGAVSSAVGYGVKIGLDAAQT